MTRLREEGSDEDRAARRWRLPDWSVIGTLVVVSLLAFGAFMTGLGWLAGLAAGIAQVRRAVSGRSHTVGDFAAATWNALRHNWLMAVGGLAVAVLLYMNVVWLGGGYVPGGPVALGGAVGIAALVWAVLLRAAALWSNPEGEASGDAHGWWPLVQKAARISLDDPLGTLGLLAALTLTIGLVMVFPPIFILLPGLWVLAGTVVESRRLGA